MKKDIHPQYNSKATIKCACGATFDAGSTQDAISVEVCSQCHPFYTGKQKLVDTAGRVDKFRARMKAAESMKETAAKRAKEKAIKEAENTKPEDKDLETNTALAKGEAGTPTPSKKDAGKDK